MGEGKVIKRVEDLLFFVFVVVVVVCFVLLCFCFVCFVLFLFFFSFFLFTFENDVNLFWVYQNENFLPGKN